MDAGFYQKNNIVAASINNSVSLLLALQTDGRIQMHEPGTGANSSLLKM